MANLGQSLKESFNEFKSDPGRIFGLLYPYVLIIGIGIGLVYTANINEIARRDISPKLPDTTQVSDLKVVDAKSVPPLDILSVKSPSDELLSQGNELYATICQSCHGDDGKGNGPGAAGLNPAPRDFTNPDGWKNGAAIPGIFTTLTEGIPGTSMIAYDYLTPSERVSLAHYVRQTYLKNPPSSTDDELKSLDATYNLSAGAEIPAQIPVSAAVDLILKETEEKNSAAVNTLQGMAKSNEPGAEIFNRIAANKVQALNYLKASGGERSENFRSFVSKGVNRFTFNKNVYSLNDDEWKELEAFLGKYL